MINSFVQKRLAVSK